MATENEDSEGDGDDSADGASGQLPLGGWQGREFSRSLSNHEVPKKVQSHFSAKTESTKRLHKLLSYPSLYKPILTNPDLSKPIQTYPNQSKQIQTCPNQSIPL